MVNGSTFHFHQSPLPSAFVRPMPYGALARLSMKPSTPRSREVWRSAASAGQSAASTRGETIRPGTAARPTIASSAARRSA